MSKNQEEFRDLAQRRLTEARLLLEAGHPSGAYYLAGYAVECMLKARIAGGFRAAEIPNLTLVRRIYTHDLLELVRIAGLEADLTTAAAASPVLQARWSTIAKWSESARYEFWTHEDAAAMLDAIDGDEEGLFSWLMNRP